MNLLSLSEIKKKKSSILTFPLSISAIYKGKKEREKQTLNYREQSDGYQWGGE